MGKLFFFCEVPKIIEKTVPKSLPECAEAEHAPAQQIAYIRLVEVYRELGTEKGEPGRWCELEPICRYSAYRLFELTKTKL